MDLSNPHELATFVPQNIEDTYVSKPLLGMKLGECIHSLQKWNLPDANITQTDAENILVQFFSKDSIAQTSINHCYTLQQEFPTGVPKNF